MLTILVGPDVKFYAMRLVCLTPALSCIRLASEGRGRAALYRAFKAALVLEARIFEDSPHHQLLTGAFDIYLPAVFKLRKWQHTNFLEFQIKKQFVDRQRDRLLYVATMLDGKAILVKFIRRYYLADAVPVTMHKCISQHFERWEDDLQGLIAEFHNKGFDHGDLRDANILSGDDGSMKLVDFDWGGRDGEVSRPGLTKTWLTDGPPKTSLISSLNAIVRAVVIQLSHRVVLAVQWWRWPLSSLSWLTAQRCWCSCSCQSHLWPLATWKKRRYYYRRRHAGRPNSRGDDGGLADGIDIVCVLLAAVVMVTIVGMQAAGRRLRCW